MTTAAGPRRRYREKRGDVWWRYCHKCETWKEENDYNFRRDTRHGRVAFEARCRECYNAYQRPRQRQRYRDAHPAKYCRSEP